VKEAYDKSVTLDDPQGSDLSLSYETLAPSLYPVHESRIIGRFTDLP